MKYNYFTFIAVVALLFAGSLGTQANNTKHYAIVLMLNDGNQQVFQMKDYPQIRWADQGVEVSTQSSGWLFSIEQVSTFSVQEIENNFVTTLVPNAVESSTIEVSQDGNAIVIHGTPNAEVYVYTSNGTLLQTSTTNAEGRGMIPLSALAIGTYIVKCQTQSFKMIRR